MTELLRKQIESGYRYLVVELVTRTAQLSNGQDLFQRPGGPGLVQFMVVDLADILKEFEQKAPAREVFTLTEIAEMAQEKSPTVNVWVRDGLLEASVRDRDGTRGRAMLFDRTDAFVACLLASLRRQAGLPLKQLGAISALLRDPSQAGTSPPGKGKSARKKKQVRS